MSQALYRKWRPARFDDVIGQEHVTRTLRNSIVADRVGHAYLFCGPRGTGKTTSARLLAKAVNCLAEDPVEWPCGICSRCIALSENRYLDLIEIDAASNTGVDDIRELRDKINFSPSEGRYKVYIIDEVHMLSTAAFNALLKTLEEPPPHAKFILATTEEHKVPATIKSRCQQYNFRLLSVPEIKKRLQWLLDQESIEIEAEALTLIARQGAGSLRDAESLLDQLVTAPGDQISLARTQSVLGVASNESVKLLTDAWLHGDGAAGLNLIHGALASGSDARQMARQMVTYLRQLLLLRTAGSTAQLNLDLPAEQEADMVQQAKQADRRALIAAVKRFNEAAVTAAGSWQPQLPLELAFIELLPDHYQPAASITAPAAAVQAVRTAATSAVMPPNNVAAPERVKPAKKVKKQFVKTPPAATVAKAAPAQRKAAQQKAAPELAGDEQAVSNQGGSLNFAAVAAAWSPICKLVEQEDKNLAALLSSSARPVGLEGGNKVVVGFDYSALKDKFESKDGSKTVADAISKQFGTACHVQVVLSGNYSSPETAVSAQDLQALADELGGVVQDSE